MSAKILLMLVLWLPMQASLAAIVDQDLELALTIGFIGSSVPEPYASDLSVGDVLNGTITAQNVDDAVDDMQNTVLMVDHTMTISGVSYDRATSGAGSGQNAFVTKSGVRSQLFLILAKTVL